MSTRRSVRWMVGAAGCALLALCVCTKERPRVNLTLPSGPPSSASGVAARAVTVEETKGVAPDSIPTSFAHCLEPPFAPGPSQLPAVLGLTHALCSKAGVADPRQHVFFSDPVGAGSRSLPTVTELADRIVPALPAGTEWGVGPCCADGPLAASVCIRLERNLCAERLEQLVTPLAAVATREKLGILVSLLGALRPRCQPGEEACEPIPYHRLSPTSAAADAAGMFTLPHDPALVRVPTHALLGVGTCTHDGQCERGGCGNHCVAWYEPQFAARCPLYRELDDAHCGCVERRCSWFTFGRNAPKVSLTDVEVEGWGELEVGATPPDSRLTGAAVVEDILTGSVVQRRLQRCLLEEDPVPDGPIDSLRIEYEVGLNGRVRNQRFLPVPDDIPGRTLPTLEMCLKAVLTDVRFPARSSMQLGAARKTVARVRVTVQIAL